MAITTNSSTSVNPARGFRAYAARDFMTHSPLFRCLAGLASSGPVQTLVLK
jgi:hypothetical protein